MKNIKFVSMFVVVMLMSGSLTSCKKPVAVVNTPTPPKQEETKKTGETPPKETKDTKETKTTEIIPNYEVIKKTQQDRKDGGITYYVLIRPINLSNNAFVGQIKNLVKKLVKTEAKKENVTIEIFDSLNALDWVVSKKDMTAPLLKTRYVAKYVGNAEGEKYKNTLYIYPRATKDTLLIKDYIDIIDFDPSMW